jgi:hypothetical protein
VKPEGSGSSGLGPSAFPEGGITTDLTTGADGEGATLAWLVSAVGYARAQGQEALVGYLEAVMEDAVFEMELAATAIGAVQGTGASIDSERCVRSRPERGSCDA